MNDIGAKVYRMALNSSASHGDTDLEWIHTGEEVVRHSDYEIALKRILEIEEQVRVHGDEIETLQDQFRNGIKYDEDNNQYVLCWTKREIDTAKAEADRMYETLKELPTVDDNWKVRDEI